VEYVRWVALAVLLLFAGYTVYASRTENFWKSLKTVLALKWGRQVTADLYIGLLLFTFIIYLNEGSAFVTLAWLIPTLIFGNLVTLIYFVLNFATLVGHFA
jgi:hypothetical protein